MMETKVDILLKKLNKHPVDNDEEFLECLIDLNENFKRIEERMLNIEKWLKQFCLENGGRRIE